jgi:hypothetical protein
MRFTTVILTTVDMATPTDKVGEGRASPHVHSAARRTFPKPVCALGDPGVNAATTAAREYFCAACE